MTEALPTILPRSPLPRLLSLPDGKLPNYIPESLWSFHCYSFDFSPLFIPPDPGHGMITPLLVSNQTETLYHSPPGPFSTPLLLTVSSEIPVAILGLNFRAADFASVPLTSLSPPTVVPVQPSTSLNSGTMPGFGLGLPPAPSTPTPVTPPSTSTSSVPATLTIGGAGSLVFPEVAIGGGWFTQIAIGNTSSASQIIRIDFFGENGVNTSSLTDIVILPRGVFFFSSESAGAF